MTKKQIIGFIGIGYMGVGMAKNILASGYELYILGHKKRKNIERLITLGAIELSTPKELADKCDIIHICVNDSPTVEKIMLGENGILETPHKDLIIVDTSTSDPVSTLKLIDLCKKQNVIFIDAPLSKTPKEAEEGTLDCMIGADKNILEKLRPIIETWASNIIHVGAAGNGHKMKLINNFIALGYGALYSEALITAQKAGLTIDDFHAVIGSGRMRNGFYDTFMKYVHGGDKNAHQFTLKNALKDMSYLTSLTNSIGINNQIQSSIRNSYAIAVNTNKGDDFVPQLYDVIATLNGLKNIN